MWPAQRDHHSILDSRRAARLGGQKSATSAGLEPVHESHAQPESVPPQEEGGTSVDSTDDAIVAKPVAASAPLEVDSDNVFPIAAATQALPAEAFDTALTATQVTEVGDDAFSAISTEVVAILLSLLGGIDIPDKVRSAATALYHQLQDPLELDQLLPVLDQVIAIVHAALGRDQADFSSFLTQLDGELGAIREFLEQVVTHAGERVLGVEQLQAGISAGMTDLVEASSASTQLDQLQATVAEHIASITHQLDAYSQSRLSSEQSLNDEVTSMRQRIAHLEQEASKAEAQLQEQQSRLLMDTLTGLPNRLAYEQRIAQEYQRWQRYDRPLVLVVCDVDLFKSVNDTYGHQVGDRVLKLIGMLLKKHLRTTDFVARIGGEEFVLLLPETPADRAVQVADKIRQLIADSPFRFGDQPLAITASFGVSAFSENDAVENVFERADKALYAAKAAGRNCCQRVDK